MDLIFCGAKRPTKIKPARNKTHGAPEIIMPDEATKSARAADDRENSGKVCCIAVEKEHGTIVGHLPREGLTCALRCIVTGRRRYCANLPQGGIRYLVLLHLLLVGLSDGTRPSQTPLVVKVYDRWHRCPLLRPSSLFPSLLATASVAPAIS